jgi:hypothetical protein
MVISGQTLVINGSNFLGDISSDTQVSFDGATAIPAATVQGTAVSAVVPATLFAGVHNVRVIRRVTFNSSNRPHTGFSSNPVPFQLVPVITPAAIPPFQAKVGTDFTLTLTPAVGVMQNVIFYFGDQALPVPARPVSGPATSTQITLSVPNTVAVGTVPLRVEVDGAQSRLTYDTVSENWLPQVQVSA